MKLECIVTLASPEVRLRFLAMERSLRATGCNLPLRVIPYNDSRFDLPENSDWWLDVEIEAWLRSWKSHPMMRKYQCLTISNFHFVDSDVIFLRNPAKVLEPLDGFVTSCGHWKNPDETLTAESRRLFLKTSTNWQTRVFNAGQWACDRVLFSKEDLRLTCEALDFRSTCLTFPHHDQPGINLLVFSSGVQVTNLTLPPWSMESTWAGDYSVVNHEAYWTHDKSKPYLLHWAGCPMDKHRSVDGLMEHFLSDDELQAWRLEVDGKAHLSALNERSPRALLRKVKKATTAFWHILRLT